MNHSISITLLGLTAGTLVGSKQQPEAMGQGPNILIIHCDQQRYDCLGYTGNPLSQTPNIDRLASQGMQFTRAYTPIGTSCPARQSLLSGMWPERHAGLWNYDITLPVTHFECDTWTNHLRTKGYRMGYVGKWHVHPEKTPLDFGFDDYVPEERGYARWCRDNGIEIKRVETGKTMWMGGYLDIPVEQSNTHWLAGKALELIIGYEKEGKPWHVRLDHSEPHLPCMPVKEYYDKYAGADIPEWGNFRDDFDGKPYIQKQQVYNWALQDYTWDDWQGYMRSYHAVVSQLDDAIGILIGELEKRGLMDNTIVVYTTDHGDASGSHRMIDKHYVAYEEEVHVPLIIRWDGHVEPGSVCDRFVMQELDLAATVCDLAGLDYNTQGMSLLPLLRGQEPEQWRKYAFSNYNGQQFGLFVLRMIRDERFKYVWNPTDTDEFYDLEKDPFEMTNQIGDPQYAAQIARLRQDLYEELQQRGDAVANRSSAAKRQLLEGGKILR